jgi:hypothetical protein
MLACQSPTGNKAAKISSSPTTDFTINNAAYLGEADIKQQPSKPTPQLSFTWAPHNTFRVRKSAVSHGQARESNEAIMDPEKEATRPQHPSARVARCEVECLPIR